MIFTKVRDLAGDATQSLLRRPWHAMAMMSGIMLAVASATAVLIIADTQQATVDLQFDLQRSRYAVVESLTPTSEGFDTRQLRQIAKLEPVRAAGEFSIWSQAEPVAATGGGASTSAPIVVADAGGGAASGMVMVSGADFVRDNGQTSQIWLGERLAKELGVADDDPGRVRVNGKMLKVAGVVRNSGAFDYVDRSVVMSRKMALSTVGGVGQNIRIVAKVRPGSATAVAKFCIDAADPTGMLGLKDVTPPDGKQLVKNVGGDLRRLATALGAFVGVAGIFSAANTLMMSVLNRRREVGLRSALGWSRRRIGTLVLLESAIAGLIAGVVGAAAGSATAAVVAWQQHWTLVVAPWLTVSVIASAVVASLLGGSLPALRAASISPLEAMRS